MTSQGAFFVTYFSSFLHHKAIKVLQEFDPSIASSWAKSACSQRISQNFILLDVTPALSVIIPPESIYN
jgi:hypothetical protein